MDTNTKYQLVGFIIMVIATGLLFFDSIPAQIREVRKPKDSYSEVRWKALYMFIFIALAFMPPMAFRICRFFACSNAQTLQNIATIASPSAFLAFIIVLRMIRKFKAE